MSANRNTSYEARIDTHRECKRYYSSRYMFCIMVSNKLLGAIDKSFIIMRTVSKFDAIEVTNREHFSRAPKFTIWKWPFSYVHDSKRNKEALRRTTSTQHTRPRVSAKQIGSSVEKIQHIHTHRMPRWKKKKENWRCKEKLKENVWERASEKVFLHIALLLLLFCCFFTSRFDRLVLCLFLSLSLLVPFLLKDFNACCI